jgi:hypothetical protein
MAQEHARDEQYGGGYGHTRHHSPEPRPHARKPPLFIRDPVTLNLPERQSLFLQNAVTDSPNHFNFKAVYVSHFEGKR